MNRIIHSRIATYLLIVFVAALSTALLIYLTPLKHFNIVPPAMNEVDPSTLYADITKHPEQYMFIDVRSPNIYEAAHAKGSINIPIENFYDEHYALPQTGKQIVLICTTGRLAAIAYGYLENWGFRNLIHVQGGVQNWAAEGLPIEGNSIPSFSNSTTTDEHQ